MKKLNLTLGSLILSLAIATPALAAPTFSVDISTDPHYLAITVDPPLNFDNQGLEGGANEQIRMYASGNGGNNQEATITGNQSLYAPNGSYGFNSETPHNFQYWPDYPEYGGEPEDIGETYYVWCEITDQNTGAKDITWHTSPLTLDTSPEGCINWTPPVPPDDSGNDTSFSGMIAAASSGMSSTTGFDIQSVINWSGDNLIKLFIGSALAVIYALRYWLAALAIIGGVIFFAYKALKHGNKLTG